MAEDPAYDKEAWPELREGLDRNRPEYRKHFPDQDLSKAAEGQVEPPDVVLLDSGPLGLVSHPNAEKINAAAVEWLEALLSAGVSVLVAEIADYEVRRELLRAGRQRGVRRLDELKEAIGYRPITTRAMIIAAGLWAEARKQGQPTAPDPALDADVILAAQARDIESEGQSVIVATTNPHHLSRFVEAKGWQEIGPQPSSYPQAGGSQSVTSHPS